MPELHLVLLTVPHPATRRAGAYLQTVLATCGRPISCEIATCASRVIRADEIAVYLRAGAVDAIALGVTADLHAMADRREAFALAIHADRQWSSLPRLSLEALLATPEDAVTMLCRSLGVRSNGHLLDAAKQHIALLRTDVAPYDHPLAFLASIEPCAAEDGWVDYGLYPAHEWTDITHLVADDVPRSALIVNGENGPIGDHSLGNAADWTISHVVLADPTVDPFAQAPAYGQGVVHFHHIGGKSDLGHLLDGAVARLASGGLLSGAEMSSKAAESVLAGLTQGGDPHELTFLLSGHEWLAVPPLWRR